MSDVLGRKMLFLAALGVATWGLVGCGGGFHKYPLKEPLWRDPDRVPFADPPPENFSPTVWDAVDKSVFYPLSSSLAVEVSGEAENVNTLDEVPDSSWFTNRITHRALSKREIALGACEPGNETPPGPYEIKSGKPDGANPGVMVKAADGRLMLIKFEAQGQPERSTSADVIGSMMWHASGYYAPCNRVIFVDPKLLKIGDKATKKNERGEKLPFTPNDLKEVLKRAPQREDGLYRASTSVLLDGKPLGPWFFEGTRDGDPNDIIDHADRRDVRGMKMLCAWINHQDAREQNTLSMWMKVDKKRGFVRHAVIDWGDSLGQLWDTDAMSRRNGYAYAIDWSQMAVDFLTFGFKQRPWDKVEYGPAGEVWGFTDVKHFKPDSWRVGYPAPPFHRATERDNAWTARLLARIGPEHVDAMVDVVKLANPVADSELRRILKGRLRKIQLRYLTRLSPLAHPEIRKEGKRAKLCLEDMAKVARIDPAQARSHRARAYLGDALKPQALRAVDSGRHHVCTELPEVAGASKSKPGYLVVDVASSYSRQRNAPPARAHLYHLGGAVYRVVALERPESLDPPG